MVRSAAAAATVICMPSASRSSADHVKRRPKDRKIQIARAATDAFSELGYHAVSMENIAARVGISAAALYRHSQGKYDLFRDVVLTLGRQLVDATAFADDVPADADPEKVLSALTRALIDTTIVNRTTGGLSVGGPVSARGRPAAALAEQIKLINRRLQRPLVRLRPKLTRGNAGRCRRPRSASSAALPIIDRASVMRRSGRRSPMSRPRC